MAEETVAAEAVAVVDAPVEEPANGTPVKAAAAETDDVAAADKSADLSASISKDEPVEEEAVELVERQPATEADPLTAEQAAIIRQVEYYFSDQNLARDKFLQAEVKKSHGWVAFSVLLTFKRLLALSSDAAVIVDALLRSADDLLQISADRLRVRRNPDRPLPEQNENTRKELVARTAYVKGFPLDATIGDLIKFFEAYANVSNVIMRRYQDKPTKEFKFKGSVFVSFKTKDDCAAFLALEKVEHDGKVLERKWEEDYFVAKRAERSSDKKKSKKEDENRIQLPKGAIIHLDGLSEETTRESIKAALQELGGEVAYIDYTKGEKAGHVRFTTENSAAPLFAKFSDAKLAVDGVEAIGRVLDGDEETEFLAKVVENMKSRRQHGNGRFKGRNNKFSGNRKRNAEASADGEPVSKK